MERRRARREPCGRVDRGGGGHTHRARTAGGRRDHADLTGGHRPRRRPAASAGGAHLEHPEALRARDLRDLPLRSCSSSQRASGSAPRSFPPPGLRRPAGEPCRPLQHQGVQGLLPDPDRRVRPDRIRGEALRHLFGRDHVDVGQTRSSGVLRSQLTGALADVHRPDLRVRVQQRRSQRDRPPTAAEVHDRRARWRRRDLVEPGQQHRGRLVEAVAAEDRRAGDQIEIAARQAHLEREAPVIGRREGVK